jgi:proline iminopeptidase
MQHRHDGEGYCESAGVRIWYRVDGAQMTGLPLLMLHGGPGATARPFEQTIGPLLALTRPVVYLDSRGAGRSGRPDDPAQYSLRHLARDAETLRDHLGIDQWAVFGHSMGAATAIMYATAQPERTAALLLCSPLIHGPSNSEASLAHKVARLSGALKQEASRIYQSEISRHAKEDALLKLIDQRTRYGFQFYNSANYWMLDEIQARLARDLDGALMDAALVQGLLASGLLEFDGYASLPRLLMPQAVLVSPHDSEVSFEAALRYVAMAPDAQLVVFHHSGHHPYLEEAVTCARHVIDFLSEHQV